MINYEKLSILQGTTIIFKKKTLIKKFASDCVEQYSKDRENVVILKASVYTYMVMCPSMVM